MFVVLNDNYNRSEYQLSQYAPKFLWLLRDFVLEIRDVKGRKVSPKEYLESALTEIPTDEHGKPMRSTDKSERTRTTILNFFRNRDCLTMVRPTNGNSDFMDLIFNRIKSIP